MNSKKVNVHANTDKHSKLYDMMREINKCNHESNEEIYSLKQHFNKKHNTSLTADYLNFCLLKFYLQLTHTVG